MPSRLQRLVLEALEAATPSMEVLADRLRLSTSALRRYRLGNRTPSPEIVRAMVGELRGQAQSLERLAEQLEEVLKRKGEDHG
jgi:transcriptional regulator with XRE-family HTH domain